MFSRGRAQKFAPYSYFTDIRTPKNENILTLFQRKTDKFFSRHLFIPTFGYSYKYQ